MSQKFFEKFGEKTILADQEKVSAVLRQLRSSRDQMPLAKLIIKSIVNLEKNIASENDAEIREKFKNILKANYEKISHAIPEGFKETLFIHRILCDSHYAKREAGKAPTTSDSLQYQGDRYTQTAIMLKRDVFGTFHLQEIKKNIEPGTYMFPASVSYSTKTICSFHLDSVDNGKTKLSIVQSEADPASGKMQRIPLSGQQEKSGKETLSKHLDKSTVDFINALLPGTFPEISVDETKENIQLRTIAR